MNAPTYTILIVDDDPIVLHMAAEALRAEGYAVLTAGSGPEALAIMTEQGGAVDLLLTDVQLPGMDGGELAETVLARHPGTRALFMSGYSAGAALHDSVREEGVAFLPKPFIPQVLLRNVRSVLEAAR